MVADLAATLRVCLGACSRCGPRRNHGWGSCMWLCWRSVRHWGSRSQLHRRSIRHWTGHGGQCGARAVRGRASWSKWRAYGGDQRAPDAWLRRGARPSALARQCARGAEEPRRAVGAARLRRLEPGLSRRGPRRGRGRQGPGPEGAGGRGRGRLADEAAGQARRPADARRALAVGGPDTAAALAAAHVVGSLRVAGAPCLDARALLAAAAGACTATTRLDGDGRRLEARVRAGF
mmetsp:Transcript_82940/g.234979  ORF Transcript_82940/g.234979 Transcript_82940/m.234979 type:complete len:234 (+) Transcript_82940:776-1477(+)